MILNEQTTIDDAINDSRRIADSVISSINSIDRLEIQVGQETKSELDAIRESLQNSLSNERWSRSSSK